MDKQLQGWLEEAGKENGHALITKPARAIIGPHAGYRYCGHVFPYAYRHIEVERVERVFLLGPSHHLYTRKCVLSSATHYETPLGNMEIDEKVYQELTDTGLFELMSLDADEAEHSLELHTPYIVKIMRGRRFTLVPIMVGSLSSASERRYGEILGPYLDDPANLFIISSDFCHWGSRFSFTFYDSAHGPIWKSIEWLDHEAIKAIESGSAEAFSSYLSTYRNTICGRHPIGVLLNMLTYCKSKFDITFTHYDQSSKCEAMSHSSVSYAAAVVTPK